MSRYIVRGNQLVGTIN